MQIRDSLPKDKEAISEMYYQLYPNFKGPKEILSLNEIKAKSIVYVAEEKEEIIGLVVGTFIVYGVSKYGYIEELYVKESFRRKGIGKQLICKILEEYKELETWALFLMTKKEDAVAQAFYTKMGFKKSKGLWMYMEW